MAMDAVDDEIKGAEMQFVEVELDLGEAGSMMFLESGIVLDTVFGDGSQANSGLWGALQRLDRDGMAFVHAGGRAAEWRQQRPHRLQQRRGRAGRPRHGRVAERAGQPAGRRRRLKADR